MWIHGGTYAPETNRVTILVDGLEISTEMLSSCHRIESAFMSVVLRVFCIPPREGLENFPPRPRGAMMRISGISVCRRLGGGYRTGFLKSKMSFLFDLDQCPD